MAHHKATCIRALSLFCAAFLLFSALCGCGYRPTEPTSEDLTPVGTVENYTVYYEELFYLTMTLRDTMKEEYGEGIFDPNTSPDLAYYREELTERVYKNLTASYAVLSLARDRTGYTAEDAAEYAEESVAELYESAGGAHAYRKLLHENYMTDHFVRFQYTVNELRNTLLYHYVNSLGEIESDPSEICTIILESGLYARTRHIAIFKDNGKSNEENRRTAESILTALESGEKSFTELLEVHNEDTAQTSDGYYFMQGEMQAEYEDAAFLLDVGKTSGIVETSSAYFILRRLPLEETYVYMNCYGEGAPLYESYQEYTFLALLDEEQENLTFVPNEYCLSLDLTSLTQDPFVDPLYILQIICYVLIGAAVAALIVWWCVASVRADRKSRNVKRQTKRKKR